MLLRYYDDVNGYRSNLGMYLEIDMMYWDEPAQGGTHKLPPLGQADRDQLTAGAVLLCKENPASAMRNVSKMLYDQWSKPKP
jgi:hypothetical protein